MLPLKKKSPIRRILPRQIPPKLIELDYAGRLVRRIINPARAAYAPLVRVVRARCEEAQTTRKDAIGDEDGDEQAIRDLLKAGARKLAHSVDQSGLDKLAKKYAEATSVYQKKQLHKQLTGVLGADPLIADKNLSSRVKVFIDHNVSLVKRIPNELHEQLSNLVERGISESWLTPDLANVIADRFNVAESHARLIARDQIGQFYADVNHDRQRNLGVTRFVWTTVHDERVRGDPDGLYPKANPSHFELDGQVFSYDDPPINEATGLPFLPGDDFQCRCYSSPILDDLLEGDDDENNPPEEDNPDPSDDDNDV